MSETAWIVVKQWPGGKMEPVTAYTDEQQARYAASQLIGREECWIVFWTVPFEEPDTVSGGEVHVGKPGNSSIVGSLTVRPHQRHVMAHSLGEIDKLRSALDLAALRLEHIAMGHPAANAEVGAKEAREALQ